MKKHLQHIRVFISSTFQDMQDERDCLMKFIFPELRKVAAEHNVTFAEVDLRWGITEDESQSKKVLEICLQEIDNCIPFFIGIVGNRYGWCPTKEDLSHRSLECYKSLPKYIENGISATEIEIQYGVLERKEKINAFFYIKNDNNTNIDEKDKADKLSALKNAIRNQERYPVSYYDTMEVFAEEVKADFISLLDELYPVDDLTPYMKQEMSQEFVVNRLCKAYIPVSSYSDIINDWVDRNSDSLMVVYGESGLGKSAFLANWISQKSNVTDDSHEIFYYFINNYITSESLTRILSYISESLIQRYKLQDIISIENNISNPFLNFSSILDIINLKNISKPIIIIDGINQLEKYERSKLMGLLCSFSSKVRFIISAIDLSFVSDLKMFSNLDHIEILPLNENQKAELVIKYLKLHGRSLNDWQLEKIIKSSQCDNTLILKSLLDELMLFGFFDELDSRIDYYLSSQSGCFYNCFLSRLESDYGLNITKDILCLILLSKAGLPEQGLKEMLNIRNLEFSQFTLALVNQLINKDGYLRFSHNLIMDEVKNRYLNNPEAILNYREKIIEYFENSDYTRSSEEVAWQLHSTGQYDRLHSFLMKHANVSALLNNDCISFAYYWRTLIQNGYHLQDYIDSEECVCDGDLMNHLGNVSVEYFNDYETANKLYSRAHNILVNHQNEFMDFLETTFEDMIKDGSIFVAPNLYNPNDLCNQARILVSKSNYRDALDLYEKAYQLIIDRQYTDPDERSLKFDEIEVLINIADVKDYLGDSETAKNDYRVTYSKLLYLKKENSSAIRLYDLEIDLLINLSTTLKASDERLSYLNEALRLQQQYFGLNNHRMVIILMNLGAFYNDILRLSLKASKYYRQALEIQISLTGENNITVANVYCNLCNSSCHIEDAFEYFEKARQIYELLENPLGLAKLYHCFATLNYNEALYASAYTFYAQSLMLRHKHLGGDHPLSQEALTDLNEVGNILNRMGFIDDSTFGLDLSKITPLDVMIKAAEIGISAAQFNLGNWYYYGEGVDQDMQKGIKLLKESWSQGNVKAANLLMQIYIEKDYTAAFNYILPAAEKGDYQAQYYVGTFYSNGIGVGYNLDESIKWYRKSAEQYFVDAYNGLAWNLYLKNNFQEALHWALLAIEESPEDYNAFDTIAQIYKSLGLLELALKHFDKCKELKLKYEETEESIKGTELEIKKINSYLFPQP